MNDSRKHWLLALLAAAILSSCTGPLDDPSADIVDRQSLREIEPVILDQQSRTPPKSIEQATEEGMQRLSERKFREDLPNVEITLEEVRAAALQHNLDLAVELFNPGLADEALNVELAKFESTFVGSMRRSITDSPTALGTEGTSTQFDQIVAGVNVPLRTGGTINVDVPFTSIDTNNPFSLLNPAYTSDVRFSISQPLLRGGWDVANLFSIRVAQYQAASADARTRLEAIRILANADRAYWRLYSARRQFDVAVQQYDLAVAQLEKARRQVRAGDAAEIEITRAESGVAQRLEAIIIAGTAIRRTQRDLKRVMNRPDLPLDSRTDLIPVTQAAPMGLDLDPRALADHAVANRMEMLELELQLAIDASTIDFQRNAALPLVVVDYSYNIGGLGTSTPNAIDQVVDRSFEDHVFGLRAEIPIGNEAAEARVNSAILQRLQRLATKQQRRTAIEQEVFDALDQLNQTWQRILAARQEAILAGRTFEAEQRQFNVGVRTSTDVLDAAARLADAQFSEIQALAEYQIALIDIAFATGTLLGHDRIVWTPVPGLEETTSVQ